MRPRYGVNDHAYVMDAPSRRYATGKDSLSVA